MSYNFRKDIYMLEDILGYKTEEFFGYKREKRKIFSKGNREEFFNMISRKNELFDKVSQIISSYGSCLISYSTERFKNSELAEVQIIPEHFVKLSKQLEGYELIDTLWRLRYTIEIVRENNEYKIKQFLGRFNSSNYTEEHIISLEKKLNEINLKQNLT